MLRKTKKYIFPLLSISILAISSAVAGDDDLIPNKFVIGTNKKVVTGIKYALKSRSSGRYLDGRGDESEAILTNRNPVGDNYLSWFVVPTDGSLYALRSKSSNRYLDGRDNQSEAILTNRNPICDPYLQWTINETPDSYYSLKSQSSHRYLDGRGDETQAILTNRNPVGDAYLNWSFIPTAYKFTAEIEDFKYQPMVQDLNSIAKSVSVFAWAHDNKTSRTETLHPSITLSKQNENFWTFTESHERNFFNRLDVKVSAGFFGIKGKAHNTTEWTNRDKSLEETMKRNVDTTDCSLPIDIPVPPRKRVEYMINWREVDAQIPFTATVKVKGFADRLRKNGTVAEMAQVDGEGLLALLRYAGYTGELSQDGKTALAKIKGTLQAKGAVMGNSSSTEKDL